VSLRRTGRTCRAASILLLVAAGVRPAAAAAEVEQQVCLQVAMPEDASVTSVLAEVDRLGEQRELELIDDGSVPSDVSWDGVYTGCFTGAWARIVSVRLLIVEAGGEQKVAYAGTAQTPDARQAVLAWRVARRPEGTLVASRVASAWPGNQLALVESLPVVGAFGWALFLIAYVYFLVCVRRQERS